MTEETWLIVLGFVIPFVVQGLKALYRSIAHQDMPSRLTLWVTYLLCLVSSASIKVLWQGVLLPDTDDPIVWGQWVIDVFVVVFGFSQIIYNYLMKKETRLV